MTPTTLTAGAIGQPVRRIEGRQKVTGAARYAVEHPADDVAHAWIVQSTVARGTVGDVDPGPVLALPGVLAVMTHADAPRLQDPDDPELAVLQSPRVAYRGQIVAAVVATSLETAREAARVLEVPIRAEDHDVVLREGHPEAYTPEVVNPSFPAETTTGDIEAGLNDAAVVHDATYRTSPLHNSPMEPHATLAVWDDDGSLTVHDSNQAASTHRAALAQVLGLESGQVRVIARHVGGGFGSKGSARPQLVLAAMLARAVGRPVKLAVTRQQTFAFTGYRTPTIQRVRLGADADGRLLAIDHHALEQTSTLKEFAEQTCVATRMMYAAPNRHTTHDLVALDVPTPSWMRAPGECPGMFALESAMDELAVALGMDPIELRVRNEPEAEPESGRAWSSRNLVACLRDGAQRFGWAERDPTPGTRRDGRWLVGTGVAASTYPAYQQPSSARARALPGGAFVVEIAAADIGTGGRTALTQIAADALQTGLERVTVQIGDSALPRASVAGGSSGTASWGTAVTLACRALRQRLEAHDGDLPPDGLQAEASTDDLLKGREDLARHAFGAQFAEVRVDADTGEVRVPRLLGVFAAGRIINPQTARSQLIGGMTMGLSMALHEASIVDGEFGDFLNHDLAGYHVAAHADVPGVEAHWVQETDEHLNPMGSKGIGEIGIVGTAAAIANAVHHATGIRIRALPIQPDRLVAQL
ncbi:xanthine dehydrogenase family protein molybdopterin-binding subunit [Baekduia soli]|uniref:Xanthine dehydrogenase family protein molybdopterin-binding subunit n=1 Tax=Baekduia soli TaxID=496014 RepID=A0A5B8U5I6_9ACTN|nr:xanthine dehydrogenase family protein molybdopterin-binding subunit [Baekduia soli]QEC48386.1 xanthine dehydrogenase family protein molybdopterin-binding subunit [Baekduia soli]